MLVLEPGAANPWAEDYYEAEEPQSEPVVSNIRHEADTASKVVSPMKVRSRTTKHDVSLPVFTSHLVDREARARWTARADNPNP